MGIQRQNGYSATVEGYFVYEGTRIPLAKTNGASFVVVEPRNLPVGAAGDLLVIVDGQADSRRVILPEGARADQSLVYYQVAAPF